MKIKKNKKGRIQKSDESRDKFFPLTNAVAVQFKITKRQQPLANCRCYTPEKHCGKQNRDLRFYGKLEVRGTMAAVTNHQNQIKWLIHTLNIINTE
jgi:hypothetical protein